MRKFLKFIYKAVFFLAVLPLGLSARLLHRLLGSQMLFDIFSQGLSIVPGFIGAEARTMYYGQTLTKTRWDIRVGFAAVITKIDTQIGRNVAIGGYTAVGKCRIGDNTVIANYISILSGRYQHNFKDPNRDILDDADTFSEIVIGQNVFIGDHSIVMANIGDYAIVGAGSVVVKDIPEYAVAVGNPARVVKERTRA